MTIVGLAGARFAALVIVATTGRSKPGPWHSRRHRSQRSSRKYNLIGTFAWDCSKPASPNNLYLSIGSWGGRRAMCSRDIMNDPSSSRNVIIPAVLPRPGRTKSPCQGRSMAASR